MNKVLQLHMEKRFREENKEEFAQCCHVCGTFYHPMLRTKDDNEAICHDCAEDQVKASLYEDLLVVTSSLLDLVTSLEGLSPDVRKQLNDYKEYFKIE
jgi:hypothetical protein